MKRLTADNPQGNFETVLNYVYSKDGIAYIRSDGATDDVPLHEWAKRECIARGCDKSLGETMEEIDEAICDCAFDCPECPIFLAYIFACQACHLRDRLKRHEDAEADGRLVLLPCKVGDTVYRVFHVHGREPVITECEIKTMGQAADLVGRIGKKSQLVSVFLTRKEAEDALKGLEEQKGAEPSE